MFCTLRIWSCPYVNSLKPSEAYMRQENKPSMVQLMACRLFITKSFSKSMMTCCDLNPEKNIQWNLKTTTFIQKNYFENVVCKLSAILFQRECVQAGIQAKTSFKSTYFTAIWIITFYPYRHWIDFVFNGVKASKMLLKKVLLMILSDTIFYRVVFNNTGQRCKP